METKSIPGKIYENAGMIHFAQINQTLPHYSMLQHIGRVKRQFLCQETVSDTCEQN